MKEYLHQTTIDTHTISRLPGYLLVESHQDEEFTHRILNEGIHRFFAGFGEKAYMYDLGPFKLALLLPDALPKLQCASFTKDEGDFAFIEGTFYDYTLLKKNIKELVSTDLAAEVLDLCRKEQYSKLKDYNGRYSGFVYLSNVRKLIVITDSYGANRVFVYNQHGTYAVSNNIFALAKNPALKITVNEQSVAEILHYEYPAYRETEFNEIELVLPSDVHIRIKKSVKVLKVYQKVSRTPVQSDEAYIDELRASIDNYFKETYSYLQEPMGIYMSKGKDSRLFLPFLERNKIPYVPFVFKEDTGIFDYPQVKEIATLLDKDLHVLEKHSIDKNLAFLISMSTTPTSAWLALGKVAQNFVSNALMGLYGESSSGKLCAHRNFGVNNLESSVKATILGNSRGIDRQESIKWIPYFSKWNTDEIFRRIYKDFPSVEIPFDYDTYQDIDHRSFRNAIVVLFKSQHFITPISAYMDKRVADIYHRLPYSLLKSQKAHTIIASEEPKSNKVQSTAFPVSLRNEKYIRDFHVQLVKFNTMFKDFLMAQHKRKYKPYVKEDSFIPRSSYFKGIFPANTKHFVGNKRILTRLYNVDDYLYMTMEDNLDAYFKKPVIVVNQLKKVNSGINS